MKSFTIENESHTVACLLRNRLFEEGATFAACVVKHPQEKKLVINIESEDPQMCLLNSIFSAEQDIDKMIKIVKANIIHREMMSS